MVNGIIKFAEKAVEKAKDVIFADPKLLYIKQRHLSSEPFFFAGSNGKGVLLVHGWTATPYELRRLGVYLNENGYTVLGVRLTGHGTIPGDIENVKWSAWMGDVRNGYGQLRKTCDKVYVGGTSIGGALAIMLAKENSEISGLVLMATPHKIKQEKIVTIVAKSLIFLGQKYRKKFYPPTFGASATVTRLISYQTYPLASALETFALIKAARINLEKIMQPCLLMQSTHDHIVTKNSMENIYNQIGSTIKKKKYIHKAYHTFISDIKNEHVFADIVEFLEEN